MAAKAPTYWGVHTASAFLVLPGLQWVKKWCMHGHKSGRLFAMRDLDVFTQLLTLERPWAVDEVIFDAKDESIGVFLRHRSNARFRCPKCGAVLPLHDHTPPRKWRHLDHGSWLT